jgi:hypothetical protein
MRVWTRAKDGRAGSRRAGHVGPWRSRARQWPGLLALVLAVHAAGQTAAPAAADTVIAGSVVDATTGQPLKKAWVTLLPVGGPRLRVQTITVSTDAGGRFAFRGVRPGQYVLEAGRTGYVRQRYGEQPEKTWPERLTVAADTHLTDIVFRLIPAGVISGRVLDEDGEPMPWVLVQAVRVAYSSSGGRREEVAGQASTNDLGEYRIFGLPPGRYLVRASYRPGIETVGPRMVVQRSQPQSGRMAYPAALFYPNAGSPTQAMAVKVHGGQETSGIDFTMLPARAYRISGEVSLAATAGAEGARQPVSVSLQQEGADFSDPFSHFQTFVLPGESFEISGVLPGTYVLWALQLRSGGPWVARLPVAVGDSDLTGLHLVLQPGQQVLGRVLSEGGTGSLTGLQVTLAPDDGRPFGRSTATVAPDGSFVLPNVGPGRFRVELTGLPADAYLKAARLGMRDVLLGPVEFDGGGGSETLTLVVSLRGAQLSGLVHDDRGQPVASATVVLVPEEGLRSDAQLYRVARTDIAGAFVLRGIRPGRYTALAWQEVDDGAWLDPDFLRPFLDRGVVVELGEGQQKAIELTLQPKVSD